MKKIYVFLLSLIMYSAFAQDGSLDISFTLPSAYLGPYHGLAVQPNGYLLTACSFGNQVTVKRLKPSGEVDDNFVLQGTFTLPSLGSIDVIHLQNDGYILIGGLFTYTENGVQKQNLIRVNSFGNLDLNFNPGFTANFGVSCIAQQSTDKLLIGGSKLVRVNLTNGSNDLNFNPGGVSNSGIGSICVLPTNEIIIGGRFNFYNNQPRKHIAKLTSNGGLITNYPQLDDNNSETQYVSKVVLDDNNNVIVAGSFETNAGRRNIFRINNTTNSIDNSFIDPNMYGAASSWIDNFEIQKDGKIVIVGNFDKISGINKYDIARLNTDGTLDACFAKLGTGTFVPDFLVELAIDKGTNSIYTGGLYTQMDGVPQSKNLSKLHGTSMITNPDSGTVTSGVTTVTAINNVLANDTYNGTTATTTNVNVTLVSYAPSAASGGFIITSAGKVTVSPNTTPGTYTLTYKVCAIGSTCNCKNGTATVTVNATPPTLDAVDDTKTVNYGTALIFNVLDNDKLNGVIIPSGTMTVKYLSMPITYITAHKNGTITIPAGTPAGTYYLTYEICILGLPMVCDIATITVTVIGQIVAKNDDFATNCMNGITGGTSDDITLNDTMDGTPINDNIINISIINNGGIPNLTVNAFGILSIPANTAFGTYTITYRICQKNTLSCATATAKICINDGFDPGTGANGPIYAVALQDNGKIIIGGNFTEYDGKPRKRIARLNNDFSLDLNFDPQGIGFNDVVYALALQGDNILVGGLFTATGTGVLKNHLVRLNSNGLVDNTFVNNNFQYVGTSPNGTLFYIKAITLDSSGRILVGGSFGNVNSYAGTLKSKIVRLSANGNPDNTFKSILSTDSGAVHNITLLDDQTIVIGGINLKIPSKNVILYKVTSTGDLDPNFIVGQAVDVQTGLMNVTDIAKNNGKLVVVGYFNSYNNSGLSNIVQINSNGVLDGLSVFNPGVSSNGVINSVAVDTSNNNLIIGGNFSSFNGNSASKIARLTVNSTFDPSFNIGIGFDPGANNSYSIFDIKLQDSKIVAGGHFTKFNGIDAKYITRLSQDNPVIQGRKNMYTEEKAAKGISIYPNPSEGIFNIDFREYDESKFDITIYNALGQLIHKASVTPQNTNQIDLTSFGAGSYFITLQNANETINKIIVKK